MSVNYLDRESAPFGPDVWDKIDEAVVGAATAQMSARRLLEVEGPYGLGLRSIAGADEDLVSDSGATVCLSPATPVPTIRHEFKLPVRSVAAFEADGLPFDMRDVANAAIAVAHREDEIILQGLPKRGIAGLLNAPGIGAVKLEPWTDPGKAFENILSAVNVLDKKGLHGPYALALAPPLYNSLFRLYPNGGPTELEQVHMLVTGGIIKADALSKGGVLVATGKQFLSIVLGQDLMTAFIGPDCGEFCFCIMESAVLKVSLPQAVCVIG
jgi:uncharacterized linocin/CFP29 family protein